jgi:Cyclin, N-terminal domain
VVYIALNYLDRSANHWFENSETQITKREYQLLAVTSLYMAIKIHGETDCTHQRRKLKIDAFCELSRKHFDVTMIEDTERYILSALNWNVNTPSALKYISTFLSLCPKWEPSSHHVQYASVIGCIYDVARYLTELSVCQSDFSFTCKTSVVAFASILLAMENLQPTMPLLYAVRVHFLKNIAHATGYVAGNAEVLRVYDMLKSVCPGIVATEEVVVDDPPADEIVAEISEDSSVDGKSSPVCVMVTQDHSSDQDIQRKRSRSTVEENWRPIGQSSSA